MARGAGVAGVGSLAGVSVAIAARGIGSEWDDVIVGMAPGDVSLVALIKAVIARESEWNPNAKNPADPSYGLMQVMIPTARFYLPGVSADELLDPPTNITAGASYLGDQWRRFGAVEPAARAYTCGPARAGDASCKPGYVADVAAYFRWYFDNDPLIAFLDGRGGAQTTGDGGTVTLDPVVVTATRLNPTTAIALAIAAAIGLLLVLD